MNVNNPKLNKAKLITAAVLCLVLFLALGTSALAYLNQSIVQDYETKLEISTVVFRFNDRTYLDEIGSANISLVKGQPCDFELSVDIIGTHRTIVDYTIEFKLQNASGGTTNISEVTEAIEMYYHNGSRYVFLCMLSDIDNCEIVGQMITNHENTIPIRLVYSAEASEYYDNLVNTSAGQFKVVATASALVNTSSENYVFASDYDEFKEQFELAANADKTIILLDNITVTEELTVTHKIGIDLYGYTLTLNQDLNIGYSNSSAEIGLINSIRGENKTGGLAGSGSIVVTGDDCYLIDNDITSRFSISTSSASGIFNDFADIIQSRADALSDGTVYTTGSDLSFVFDNVAYYNTLFNLSVDADSVIQYDSTESAYLVTIDSALTSRYYFIFDYSYVSGSLYETVSGNIAVRGNSIISIKNDLEATLPSTISSGLYIKGYDQVTGSYITWSIDDGYGGALLDSNGLYRKNGVAALAAIANSFANSTVDIVLKITKGTETSSFLITKDIELFTTEEITAMIFENTPVVLRKNTNETYDIYADYLDSSLLVKSGISAITITDPEHGYLAIGDNADDADFDTVKINPSATIPQNSETDIDVTFTFTYGTGTNARTFAVTKTVKIIGPIASVTEFDMGYYLQNAFSNNDYIDGLGYSFYGFGGLTPSVSGESVAVMIDYFFEFDQTNTTYANAGYTYAEGYYTYDHPNTAKDYIVVTYEYVPVAIADMDDQIAYFTYSSGTYSVLQGTPQVGTTYYERKASIEVMPSRIPTIEDTTATVYAVLYTSIETVDGKQVYVYTDPATSETSTLVYSMSLDIFGVYHNDSTHIPDFNLYTVLASCFDANDDGIIGRREADATWATVCASGSSYLKSATVGGTSYSYIDLSGLEISNLKGIEYFPNIQGFDLSNNGIIDLTKLAELDNIEYLDLSDNTITDISALSYMDSLKYLNINNNSVTSIEPLRYLESLSIISLQNNRIIDFLPLTVTTCLTSLDITGMPDDDSVSFASDPDAMYSFALIKVNNPNVSFIYDSTIEITSAMQIAAEVMRDLEEINSVYKTLYLPTSYYYYDGTSVVQYSINWFCDDISLSYDGTTGLVNGYTMPDLLFSKKVDLMVQVYIPGTTNYYTLARNMEITLDPFDTTRNTYIYDAINDTYVDALTAVPDINLLNLLFDTFNRTDPVPASITINGESIPERQVISAADFTYFVTNYLSTIDWSNKGVTDLTGIEYFDTLLTHNLNLSGNTLDSLTPLASLSLTGLTLGGQTYDFTQLDGLTSLVTFDVHECYGLDDDAMLDDLYQVYLDNVSVSINIESGKVWDPYAKILPKAIQSLNSIANFVHLGQTYNIYGEGNSDFDIEMYGVNFNFTVSSVTIYDWISTSSNNPYFTYANGVITYTANTTSRNMYGKMESAYAHITLTSPDDTHTANITYSDYYVQLNVDDAGERIIVFNVSGDGTFDTASVSDIFTLRYFRERVIYRLYYRFNHNVQKLTTTPTDANGNGIVDESEIKTSLTTTYGTSGSVNYYNYFYYNAANDSYYVTTDVFKTLGSGTYDAGDVNYSTVDNAFAGDGHELDGLRFLTTIKTIEFDRDFHFGDGTNLINITTMTIKQSAIDFSTISLPAGVTLPLQSLTIQNCYIFNATAESFANFPALNTLSVARNGAGLYINDFSFLTGLINEDNKTNMVNLTLTSICSNSGSFGITAENAAIVNQLYLAAENNGKSPVYVVGSVAKNSDTGYFRVMDIDLNEDGEITADEMNLSCYCTTNNDASYSSHWGATETLSLSVSAADDYKIATSRMCDLGLQLNGVSWIEGTRIFTIDSDDVIWLPSSTGEIYYGLTYASTATLQRDYSLSWEGYACTSSGITAITPTEETNINLYTTYGNSYVVLIGTIDGAPSGSTEYSYFYQFKVGSGDGIYSAVNDLTLRAWLFANRSTVNTSITINNSQSNGDVLTKLGYHALPYDADEKNYIYDLTGINTVVNNWNKLTTITSITMLNQRFSSIAPLYSFSALQALDLSGSDTGYVTLTGIGTSLPALTTLNLTNNISITPADIALLANTASSRTGLTTLNLYGTRCMCSYSVLSDLYTLADITSGDSLTLSLNASTSNTVTKTELDTFMNNVSTGNTLLSAWIADGIDQNGTATQTFGIGSYSYTLSLPTNVAALITNNAQSLSSSVVDIKMIVSCSSYDAQFVNIFVDSTYAYSGGANNMQFGASGAYITDFDTQLIAYLFNNGFLSDNGSGFYVLNSNVSINSDLGIESLANVSSLNDDGTSYTVTLAQGSNKLYYASEGAIVTNKSYTYKSRTIDYSDALVYLDLLSNYTYSNTSYFPYTATMPIAIYIDGTSYTINWSVTGDTSTFFEGGTNGEDLVFTISGASGGNVYTSSSSYSGNIVVHAKITVGATTVDKTRTLNINKTGVVSGSNMFVQVTVIGEGETYNDAYSDATYSTVDDVVILNGTGNDAEVCMYLGAVDYTTLHYKNNKYYANLTDTAGATVLYAVTPNMIFQSGRLLHYLINTRSYSDTVTDATTNNTYGKIVSTARRLATTSLSISAANESVTQGIVTIEGVQMYCNLTSFTLFAGYITNIEPLRNLTLTTFYYGNSEVGTDKRDFTISDFSPLLDGSKDSLVTFSYDSLGSVQMTDLSFLLGFTHLEEVYVCSSGYYFDLSARSIEGAAYLKTASFKYILSQLNNKGIKFYVHEDNITKFNLKYDINDSVYYTITGGTNTYVVNFHPEDINVTYAYKCYALTTTTEYSRAAEVLNGFTPSGNGFTLSNGYDLTVGSSAYTLASGKATFNLTATINKDGSLYLIDWRAASANVTIEGYFLTTSVTVGGVTYGANGAALTEAQAKTLIASTDYYTYAKNGTTQLYVKVTANVVRAENIAEFSGTRLLCRITVDDYAYEKTITLDFTA